MSTSTAVSHPQSAAGASPFVQVKDLKVHFPTDDGLVKSVDGLTFSLERGKTLVIVGESGSGKSVTSQAIMGLHRRTRAHVSGQIVLDGQDLTSAGDEELRRLRGGKMAMIFQDPLSALHPYYSIGAQIVEAINIHHPTPKAQARNRTIEILERVGIPNPKRRFEQYPHEFSGGMRQRAMIAMALINDPQLLIADEPTTALDVTVQAQILDLMRDLQKEFGSAILMITHDLGVVAEIADDVLVMYGGRAVEYGTVNEVFYGPQHPYAWGLMTSMPRMDRARKTRLDPVPGNPPSLINIPSGCPFHPRCGFKANVPGDMCWTVTPPLDDEAGPGHLTRCHIPGPRRAEIFETEVRVKL